MNGSGLTMLLHHRSALIARHALSIYHELRFLSIAITFSAMSRSNSRPTFISAIQPHPTQVVIRLPRPLYHKTPRQASRDATGTLKHRRTTHGTPNRSNSIVARTRSNVVFAAHIDFGGN